MRSGKNLSSKSKVFPPGERRDAGKRKSSKLEEMEMSNKRVYDIWATDEADAKAQARLKDVRAGKSLRSIRVERIRAWDPKTVAGDKKLYRCFVK